jgi:galactose mutarotase-like enzyme
VDATERRAGRGSGPGHDHVMVYSGDQLERPPSPQPAVEPMTCAPDAYHSGAGLRVLEPGETFAAIGESQSRDPPWSTLSVTAVS